MDDVILAVVRRNSARRQVQIEAAMASPEPLRALWEMTSDPSIAITASELVALANHRAAIQAEIVVAAREMRALQIELVGREMDRRGIDRNRYPAGAVVTIGAALARALAQDSALGVVEGYDEAVELLERALDLFRGPEDR
jgi:hypothetical protein